MVIEISYNDFNWQRFVSVYNYNNNSPKRKIVLCKQDAWYYWLNCNQCDRLQYFLNTDTFYNNSKDYHNFDWKTYLSINNDLVVTDINTKEKAWAHWNHFGIREERSISFVNNTNVHCGRFGNLFFLNMAVHFISSKWDLKFNYKYYAKFKNLGVDFFLGWKTYDKNQNYLLEDGTFFDVIKGDSHSIPKNIIVNNSHWCQTRAFAFYLRKYFNKLEIKKNVIEKNIFKHRYNNNNDLFVHVRLGDIENKFNSTFEYYDRVISSVKFTNGYISSDTINSDICQKLVRKYNLIIFHKSEIDTLMFASTCNFIVLSGGTFSWLIGFLGYYTKSIFYPNKKNQNYYGDIFVFPEWSSMNE